MNSFEYDEEEYDEEDYIEDYYGVPKGVCPYPVKSIVHAPYKWWCGCKLKHGQNFCDKHSKCVTM